MPISCSAVRAYGAASLLATALPIGAQEPSAELMQLRHQIAELRQSYELRLQALEGRLAALQAGGAATVAQTVPPSAVATPPTPHQAAPAGVRTTASSAFNPAISLILGGSYAHLSQDPAGYRLQGFIPSGGEVGPERRGFRVRESELVVSASIDPLFSGRLTAGLSADGGVEIEEAWAERQGLLGNGTLRFGRYLSGIGYLNERHAHTWDFVDAPLAYEAFFGGRIKTDGLQFRWLAPTARFFELGAELGSGHSFPGSDTGRNGVGSAALFGHVGDDVGASASWRAGLSMFHNRAKDRSYEDRDAAGTPVTNAFTGNSRTWVLDGVYKWAPGRNAARQSLTLQGEYFRRTETGSLAYDTLTATAASGVGSYRAAQSGWYLQTVYQFMPRWRIGARYDRLDSGDPRIGLVDSGGLAAADFGLLRSARPTRSSLMVDYSPSEFSRLRLQLGRDRSDPAHADRQIFLQYIMSLGTHGAHLF